MHVVDLAERLLADEDPDRALDLCADELAAIGLSVDRYPGIGALVAERGEGGAALSGHVDVVPVTEDAWEQPPFGASMQAGVLYGRGATDMRGPVACMLAALAETEAPARIVLTTDEETTMEGVRHLVDEGVLASAPVIAVGEPTELDVAVAGKGLVWARVDVGGARGHASTPRGPNGRGPSAAERLVAMLGELDGSLLKVDHPRVGPATLAISGLETEPTPFNVLAGEGQARIDVRFPPPKTPSDVERALRSRLDLPREGVELAFAKREPAFLGEEAGAERAREALSLAGLDVDVTGVHYVSEAGHWQRASDTLVLGPGSIDRAHGPDEHITREELVDGQRAYEAVLEAWA